MTHQSSRSHTHLMIRFLEDDSDRVIVDPKVETWHGTEKVYGIGDFRHMSALSPALPLAELILGILRDAFQEKVIRNCGERVPDMWLRLWESNMILKNAPEDLFCHPDTRLCAGGWQEGFFAWLLAQIDEAIISSERCKYRRQHPDFPTLAFRVKRDYERKAMTLELVFTSLMGIRTRYGRSGDPRMVRLAVGVSIEEISGETRDFILASRQSGESDFVSLPNCSMFSVPSYPTDGSSIATDKMSLAATQVRYLTSGESHLDPPSYDESTSGTKK